jgi:hypothetical protein
LLFIAVPSFGARADQPKRDTTPGSIGIRLLQGPSSRAGDPRARRYIVDHVKPGATIRRSVLVVNKSPDRHRIEVYPAAASLDKERFVFGADRAANELTSWISLDVGQLDLAPYADGMVEATIRVPATASMGERYAVIWASLTSPARASTNVNQVHRTGVRLYLDVGPGGEPRSDFTISKLVPARNGDDDPSVAITVTNTGGRALDITGTVGLSDGPAGQRAGPFDVVSGTTLGPGASGTVTVRLPRQLPNGPWKIQVNLESGLVKHSVIGEITFPERGHAGAAGKILSLVSGPWIVMGGSLGVGLATLAGLAFVSRRSRNS